MNADYHCQHCKIKLFNSKDVVSHEPFEKNDYNAAMKGSVDDCCSSFFVKNLDWIDNSGGRQGLISCPRK